MAGRILVRVVAVFLLTPGFIAAAQQPKRVYRLGYLASVRGGSSEDALRRGLRDLGYIEGQNFVIESRSAEGKLDRLPGLVADLMRLNVDIIVVSSTQGALAAKKATQTIPIVFAIADDPVESGLVNSLAQPSGNATGVTDLAGGLGGKRIELLKETLPKVSRLAVLVWKPDGPGNAAERSEIELAVRAVRIRVQPVEIRGPNDLETGFAAINPTTNAFMGLTDTRFAGNRQRIVELSVKHRLRAVYPDRAFVEAGGLMSYGTNRAEWRRRIAYYVDKILKGTKPADIPVEQPTKFELVINLKAAKQIGLTIPPNVLARADRVIR